MGAAEDEEVAADRDDGLAGQVAGATRGQLEPGAGLQVEDRAGSGYVGGAGAPDDACALDEAAALGRAGEGAARRSSSSAGHSLEPDELDGAVRDRLVLGLVRAPFQAGCRGFEPVSRSGEPCEWQGAGSRVWSCVSRVRSARSIRGSAAATSGRRQPTLAMTKSSRSVPRLKTALAPLATSSSLRANARLPA